MEQLEIVKICKPAVLIGLEKAIVPKPTFHTWAKTARNLATFAKLGGKETDQIAEMTMIIDWKAFYQFFLNFYLFI